LNTTNVTPGRGFYLYGPTTLFSAYRIPRCLFFLTSIWSLSGRLTACRLICAFSSPFKCADPESFSSYSPKGVGASQFTNWSDVRPFKEEGSTGFLTVFLILYLCPSPTPLSCFFVLLETAVITRKLQAIPFTPRCYYGPESDVPPSSVVLDLAFICVYLAVMLPLSPMKQMGNALVDIVD